MKEITILVDDDHASPITELLLSEAIAFSVKPAGVSASATEGRKPSRKSPFKITGKNKSLLAVLQAGTLSTSIDSSFNILDVARWIKQAGLAPTTTSAAVSIAVKHGFLTKVGKSLLLTEKGKSAAKKLLIAQPVD